jgi:hypothetical protein
MPEVVDPKTGKVVNVSQRKANDASETYSSELKKTVKKAASAVSTNNVDAKAQEAVSTFTDAKASIGGQVAGQIKGGMENLTSKVDGYKDQLTDAKDTAVGLLNGDTTSLKNMGTDMINGAVSGLLSKLGTKVQIKYSDPDPETGIVTPIEASLEADPTSGAISGLLSIITGLGASLNPADLATNFKGELQNIVTDVSPEGLLSAGKDLAEGKIGAFTSTSISELSTTALKSVTDEIRSTVGSALAGAANINKEITYVTSVDVTDPENPVSSTATTTSPGIGGVLLRTDSDEFNQAMRYVDSDAISDISGRITKANEIVQDLEGAKTDLATLSGGKDGATVLTATQNATSARNDYAASVVEYKGMVSNKIAKGSQVGMVQGLSTETLTTIRQKIKEVAPKISNENVEQVILLSQGDAADESAAIRILQDNSGLTYPEIMRFIKSIDTTIANSTKLPADTVIFPDPYQIGTYQQYWNKGEGNPAFPYISSVEELQAEIGIIKREVDTVIVHWTETHTNKNIGSEEINGWHLAAGLAGIGYHYVCRRDGSLQRGRPVSLDGEHTPGFDINTIAFVFVGGINAPTGTPNAANFISAQSLTRSQINTFDHFCRSFYNVYPGIKIVGHSDVDEIGQNVDPGFDVPDYVLTRFGKNND